MTLYSAYLTSLDLALSRDIRSDTFVIKKTVSYLEKVVTDIHKGDPKIIKEMSNKLEEYFDSTIHLEVTLEDLFGHLDNDNKRIYERNIAKLYDLKARIDYLLSPNA